MGYPDDAGLGIETLKDDTSPESACSAPDACCEYCGRKLDVKKESGKRYACGSCGGIGEDFRLPGIDYPFSDYPPNNRSSVPTAAAGGG